MAASRQKLDRCIAKVLDAGLLNADLATQLKQARDDLRTGKVPEADLKALDRVTRKFEADELVTALQVIRQSEAFANASSHPNGLRVGVTTLLVRDLTDRANWSNIDARKHAINQHIHSMIAEPMEMLRPTALGLLQNRNLARNIVRELFGESSGDASASAFGKKVGAAFEYTRQRFNRAGGAIPRRADFGLPQMHDALSVAKAGRQPWKNFVRERVDRTRMYDEAGQPLSAKELDRRLDEMFESITIPGLRKPPGQTGSRATANTRQDQRHLTFRDADAWLEYFDRFGGRDIYAHITDHLESRASDIARMEILGPNPEATYRYLRDMARREGLSGVRLANLDAIWRTLSGRADDTASLKWADRMTAVRNVLTSTKLGSAMISSVSDLKFIQQTAAWNGLSATRILREALRNLNPANKADRLRAVKMGLIADHWANRALAANRLSEVTGSGFSAQLADFTMRASGLSAWTDSAQKATGMELMMVLAEQRGHALADVDPPVRRLLEQVGFNHSDWDILRSTPTDEHRGVHQVFLPNLSARKEIPLADRERVATKLLEVTYAITNAAVPSPDARVRAITTLGLQRGTWGGEAMRIVSQFKTFPVSVILQHVMRGVYQANGVDKLTYLASLTIGTTALGAVALQAKEVSKGRTPRDMVSPEFWASAFTQGGGAGIFGDFFYAGVMQSNRFGQSLAETIGGPVTGLVTDAIRVTAGQAGELIEGEDTNLGSDLAFVMQRYTPAIGSLWYTRLAYERAVIDQLQLELDPAASRKFRAERRRRAREQGQDYWWRRGELQLESAK